MGNVLTFKPLRDADEAEWGKSRTDYTFEAKRLMRELAKHRRAKYLQSIRAQPRANGRFISVPEPAIDGEVFCTTSGILAYSKLVTSSLPGNSGVTFANMPVTLPYVSILGRKA